MPGTITTTALTDDERATLDAERAASSGVGAILFGALVLSGVVCAVLGAVGYGVGGLVTDRGATTGLVIGVTLGAGAGVAAVVGGVREARGDRRRLADDLARGAVVEIRVTDAEVSPCGIGPKSRDGGLAVMLDQQRVLVLSKLAFIESPPPVVPEGEDLAVSPVARCAESWNGLAPPYAFPTRSFVLRGLESSGRILSLRTDGESIPVDREAGRVAVPFMGDRRAFMVTKRVR